MRLSFSRLTRAVVLMSIGACFGAVAAAGDEAWPPAPVAAFSTPTITDNPPGELPDNVGDNFDLAMLGPPLNVIDGPGGFGHFGSIWANVDDDYLYLGGHGMDLGGSNNVVILFLGVDTLMDNAWNLWHKSGLPQAIDHLHNVRFGEPMDVAILLGDTFGDGPSYPNFNMGGSGGYNHGQGIFYVGTNSSSFVPMASAKLSQFHGTGTEPTATQGTPGARRTTRWEAALPWSALGASGPNAVGHAFVCGVIASASTNGNDRYLSRTVLGDAAWGFRDSHRQYAFNTLLLRPQRINLLHADLLGDGIPNVWRQEHFGTPAGPRAEEDSDGDGQSNFQEYLAGTDPRDPRALFSLEMGGPELGGHPGVLRWPWREGRRYTVYHTPDLLQPFAPLVPTAGTNVLVPDQEGFYRIGVWFP